MIDKILKETQKKCMGKGEIFSAVYFEAFNDGFIFHASLDKNEIIDYWKSEFITKESENRKLKKQLAACKG